MGQLTPELLALLAPFAACFRPEVFATFSQITAAWIVTLGRRTISRVWETTGRADECDHSAAFRLFSQAVWNWDDLCRLLLVRRLAALAPGTTLWFVTDDTLCHKRGAKVAFGGIFLDAVLSSRRHKTFRYGVNWVPLGLVVQLPGRRDRFFCVNLLWRVCGQKAAGQPHQTKAQLARAMLDLVVAWLPGHTLYVVGDSAYVGKPLLRGLPENVHVVGPIHWQAGLSLPLAADAPKRRKKGQGFLTPRAWFDAAPLGWEALRFGHPKGEKRLEVQVPHNVCWYNSAGQRPLQVVLVRDPAGQWRDEALLCPDLELPAAAVILGYVRRWSVEACYFESKQLLGLHEPRVWKAASVRRAHPMAWFVGALVVLWDALHGGAAAAAERSRPWYQDKPRPTFADMLASCRLHLWQRWWSSCPPEHQQDHLDWLLSYVATAAG
jgi:hypothetical protein